MDLIFPNHEAQFDVADLARTLETKPLVRCHRVDAGHGFMNPLSSRYDRAACRFWTDWLEKKAAILGDGVKE